MDGERPATGATELDRATIFGLSGRVSIEQPSYGAVQNLDKNVEYRESRCEYLLLNSLLYDTARFIRVVNFLECCGDIVEEIRFEKTGSIINFYN